jgi:hypothetical protein
MRNVTIQSALRSLLPATLAAFALGISAPVLANPTNEVTGTQEGTVGSQEASAYATTGDNGAAANENSIATRVDDSSSDSSTSLDDSRNDNSSGRNDSSLASSRNDNSSGRNDHSLTRSQNDNSSGRNDLSRHDNDNSSGRNDNSSGRNDNSSGRNDNSEYNNVVGSHNDSSSGRNDNSREGNMNGSGNDNSMAIAGGGSAPVNNSSEGYDSGSHNAAANRGSEATVNHDESYSETWDIDKAVAESNLRASVSDNAVSVPAGATSGEITARNNFSDSFGGSAGINQVGQNAGPNGMVQQSINVQSNMRLSSGGNNGANGGGGDTG